MTVAYRISSHSTARYSPADRESHSSLREALMALSRLNASGRCVAVEVGMGDEWMVYEDQADAEADTDNSLAIARIVQVDA